MSARLYDDLDRLYREIWGTSLHHGLWLDTRETALQAKENLLTAALSLLKPSGRIADIGCGYGVLAHRIINESPGKILACTNSKVQARQIVPAPRLSILSGDWLDQKLEAESLDGAIAIESLSHFPSFPAFLKKTASALKPGARLVIADWFSETGSLPILRHLAHSGDLPPWRSLDSLIESAKGAGFTLLVHQDLSQKVAPTWTHLLFQSLLLPLRKPRSLPILFRQICSRPALLWTFPLLRLTYKTRDLSYHLISLQKVVSPRAPT